MTQRNEVEQQNTETALAYLAALGQSAHGEELAVFFADDVIQEELPSRLVPQGASHGRSALLQRSAQGRELLSAQSYEVRSVIAVGQNVALELEWRGVMKKSLGPIRELSLIHI